MSTLGATPTHEPPGEKPGLVFFFSATSGASRRAEGFLAQVLQRRGNHSTFHLHHIDADKHSEFATKLDVTDTPTLVIVDGGRIRARITKPSGCREIEQLLSPWLR